MEKVDFTEAIFDWVLFTHEVDISNCKFSVSGEFILVKDIHSVFPYVRKVVEDQWAGEDKRHALFLIDNLYYDKKKQGMKMDIVSTMPSKHSSKEFQDRLFSLIRH